VGINRIKESFDFGQGGLYNRYKMEEDMKNADEKMTVLVAGAKGFIGSRFAERLREADSFRVFECDRYTKEKDLEKYLKECDYIFYLAGRYLGSADELMADNIDGAKRLIEQTIALGNNHFKMVYASTIKIEAEAADDYTKSKMAAEEMIIKLAKKHDFPCFIYRFNNIFGERPINKSGVIEHFCYGTLRGEALKISDKNLVYNFTYVGDLVDELVLWLESDDKVEGVLHLTNYDTISLGELADKISMVADKMRAGQDFDNEFDKNIARVCQYYISQGCCEKT